MNEVTLLPPCVRIQRLSGRFTFCKLLLRQPFVATVSFGNNALAHLELPSESVDSSS